MADYSQYPGSALPALFPSTKLDQPTYCHLVAGLAKVIKMDELNIAVIWFEQSDGQLRTVFKDIPVMKSVKNNVTWLYWLACSLRNSPQSLATKSVASIKASVESVEGFPAALELQFPGAKQHEQVERFAFHIAWASHHIMDKMQIYASIKNNFVKFDAGLADLTDLIAQCHLGATTKAACSESANIILKQKAKLLVKIREAFDKDIDACGQNSGDFVRMLVEGDAFPQDITDLNSLLALIRQDPRTFTSLFPKLDGSVTSPDVIPGLTDKWKSASDLISQISTFKDSKEAAWSKKKEVIKSMADGITRDLDISQITEVSVGESFIEKIKTITEQADQMVLKEPGFEYDLESMKALYKSRHKITEKIEQLRSAKKKTEEAERQKLVLQNKNLVPVSLPKLEDSLGFIQYYWPALSVIRAGNPGELTLKQQILQSLVHQSDKVVISDPGCTSSMMIKYLLARYHNPNTLLPAAVEKVNMLKPPKDRDESLANINTFRRIYKILEKVGKEDEFLTEHRIQKMSICLLLGSARQKWFTLISSTSWWSKSFNSADFLTGDEDGMTLTPEDFMARADKSNHLPELRKNFLEFIVSIESQMTIERNYWLTFNGVEKKEKDASDAATAKKEKGKDGNGEKTAHAKSYSITADTTPGDSAPTKVGSFQTGVTTGAQTGAKGGSDKPPQTRICDLCSQVHVNPNNSKPNSSFYYCPTFIKMGFQKRLDTVEKWKRCHNCLQTSNGSTHKCPGKLRCKVVLADESLCGSTTHHTLLHDRRTHGAMAKKVDADSKKVTAEVGAKSATKATSFSDSDMQAMKEQLTALTALMATSPTVVEGAKAAATAATSGKVVPINNRMIEVKINAEGLNEACYVANTFPLQDDFFEDSERLFPNIIEIQARNLEKGVRVSGLCHLDPGSTRSFVTREFAEACNATVVSQDVVTCSTLNGEKSALCKKYKIPLVAFTRDLEEKTEVICAYGLESIGSMARVTKQDHDKLCRTWNIPSHHVQHQSSNKKVSILLGLDYKSFLGNQITVINGKEIPETFEHLHLCRSPLSRKLFYSGTVINRYLLDIDDEQNIKVGCFTTELDIHPLPVQDCISQTGDLVRTQQQLEYQKITQPPSDARKTIISDPICGDPPVSVKLPPALGSGQFVQVDGDIKEILYPRPRPRSLPASSYQVDLVKITGKANMAATASNDSDIYQMVLNQMKAVDIAGLSSALCPAHSLLKCQDCQAMKNQLSWQSLQEDAFIRDNIRIVPVESDNAKEKYKLEIDHLVKNEPEFLVSHSVENTNKVEAERSLKFCFKNAQKLDKVMKEAGHGDKIVTEGWMKSVLKDITLGHLKRVPEEELLSSPQCFAGSNVALRGSPGDSHFARSVTNGSLNHKNGCFNDCLVMGSTNSNNLIHTLNNFLLFSEGVQLDISKAYRSTRAGARTKYWLRILFFPENVLKGEESPDLDNLVQYYWDRTQYGISNSGSILAQSLVVLADLTPEEAVKLLLTLHIYVDDGLDSFQTPAEVLDVIEKLQTHLEKYSFAIKTIHASPTCLPDLPTEMYHTTALGYLVDYQKNTISLDREFNLSEKKRGLYMLENLTLEKINEIDFTLRSVARACSQCYDPLQCIIPSLIATLRALFSNVNTHVTSELCSDTKRKWNVMITDEAVLSHIKEYLTIGLEVLASLQPVPRARFPTQTTVFSGLAIYCDASVTKAAAMVYVLREDNGKITSVLNRSNAKNYTGSIPAGESFSLRMALGLAEEYLLSGLRLPFKDDTKTFKVMIMNDSQVALYNLDRAKEISDLSMRNNLNAVHGSVLRLVEAYPNITVNFLWVESERNVSDILTRLSPENARADLTDWVRHGDVERINNKDYPAMTDCVASQSPESGWQFNKEILNNQVRPETTQANDKAKAEENTAAESFLAVASLPALIEDNDDDDDFPDIVRKGYGSLRPHPPPAGDKGVLNTFHSVIHSNNLFSGVNENIDWSQKKERAWGGRDLIDSFSCSATKCTIRTPHSHRIDTRVRIIDKDLYDRVVSRSVNFKTILKAATGIIKAICILQKKKQQLALVSDGYCEYLAFMILVRSSQTHYPVDNSALLCLSDFKRAGIKFVIQRFSSYSLGPDHCRKRNLPLVSNVDKLAQAIIFSNHLVNTNLEGSLGTLHLGIKATTERIRTSRLGVFIPNSRKLVTSHIKSCTGCRRTAPVESKHTDERSLWWQEVLHSESNRSVGAMIATDILGPIQVCGQTTQLRGRKTSQVWFCVALDVASRYMSVSPMRSYSAESFNDALQHCMEQIGSLNPVAIITDAGSQIFNKTREDELKRRFGNVLVFKAPRESQFLNGLIERRIQSLKTLLRSWTNTLKNQAFPTLNLISVIHLFARVVFQLNSSPLPGQLSNNYYPVTPLDIARPLHSPGRAPGLPSISSDSQLPNLELVEDQTAAFSMLLRDCWEKILTEADVGIAKARDTKTYLPGDILGLVYPSSKQGKFRYGIVVRKINNQKYQIRYLVRKAQNMASFTLGLANLSPRLFRLIYRPSETVDGAFLASWKAFTRTLPAPTFEENRASNKDEAQTMKMFDANQPGATVTPFPPHNLPPALYQHPGRGCAGQPAALPPQFLKDLDEKSEFEVHLESLHAEDQLSTDVTEDEEEVQSFLARLTVVSTQHQTNHLMDYLSVAARSFPELRRMK